MRIYVFIYIYIYIYILRSCKKEKIQTKLNGKENIYIVVRINTTNNDMSVVIYRIFGIEELI
jgi:hypothetical protein